MHRYKKSQITVFIILGMVLLAAFSFLFYTSSIVVKFNVEKNLRKIADQIIETSAIKYYITLCLDKAVKNATITVGRQGGVIYRDQITAEFRKPFNPTKSIYGGVNSIKYPTTTDEVYYGINFGFEQGCTKQPPPFYPEVQGFSPGGCGYGHLDLNPDKNVFPFGSPSANPIYYLGDIGLEELCSLTGPNRPGNLAYNPPCRTPYGQTTVQDFISQYTSFLVKNCTTNSTSFKVEYPYQFDYGVPWTEAVIGEKDITFRVFYPIIISVEGHEPFIKILEFTRKLPVRLKAIHALAWRIVDFDSRYLYLDTSTYISTAGNPDPLANLPPTDPLREAFFLDDVSGMFLSKAMVGHSSIYTISDTLSVVGAQPGYIFRFAIPNRNPALNWTHLAVKEETRYDIAVAKGGIIYLDPRAYDPDDEYLPEDTGVIGTDNKLVYSISGWKQNWDDIFDPCCCTNYYNPSICPAPDSLALDNSVDCKNGDFTQCQVKQLPLTGETWQASQAWIDTERKASYQTKRVDISGEEDYSDLGYHDVNIRVYETEHGESYEDWQDVKILVIDKPKAILLKRSLYEDIYLKSDAASIEDPYWVSGSNSIFLTGPLLYRIEDITGKDIPDSEALYNWADTLTIPDFWPAGPTLGFSITPEYYIPDQNPNILTVQSEYFKKNNLISPSTGAAVNRLEHRMKLTAKAETPMVSEELETDWVTGDFWVYQCLPHNDSINAAEPDPVEVSAPYPYSKWAGDISYTGKKYHLNADYNIIPATDYMATHTCCEGAPADLAIPNFNPASSDPLNPAYDWGIFSANNKDCYYLDYYTCFPVTNTAAAKPPASFVLKDDGNTGLPVGQLYDAPDPTPNFNVDISDENVQNDIFQRTYTQKCSGNRGNACSGQATDTWNRAVGCPDKDGLHGVNRRCTGPAGVSKNFCPFNQNGYLYQINIPPTLPACYKYSYTTFEGHFFLTGAINPWESPNNICDETWKCFGSSVFTSNNYNDNSYYGASQNQGTGAYACQATCAIGECKRVVSPGNQFSVTCYCSDSDTTDGNGLPGMIGCAAVCDGPEDFDNTGTANDVCKNNCQLNTCAWTQTDCDSFDLTSSSLMQESELTSSSCTVTCSGSSCCERQWAFCNVNNQINNCKYFHDLITNEDETPNYRCYPGYWQWSANPPAERCDNYDNDCNSLTDESWPELGNTCSVGIGACQRSGVYVCKSDYTGTVCSATPGTPTTEVCDGLDNDCDSFIDEENAIGCIIYYLDADNDGYGVPTSRCLCFPSGQYRATQIGDCNDLNAAINPGAIEICNDGLDNDCDVLTDCPDTIDCSASPFCIAITCPNGICEYGEMCAADCSYEAWCDDIFDNDEDSYVDCADTDCDGEIECR